MGTSTKTLQYCYDSRGNRSALVDHDGGRFTYSYDAVNRITQVLNPQGDRTSYSYDNSGRRTLKKLSNGTRASFTYDAAGNLTNLYNLKSTGAVISSFDYTYDKVGNRMAALEAGSNRVTWSYDRAYQLTGEHRTGTNAYRDTYTYDPAGNRLLKNHDGARTTYTYDAANQLRYSQDSSGRTTFTFDADGNQQVIQEPGGNCTTYAWDYENRMTLARLPSGIRNTMVYDADGLRVKLEESTDTKKFVWDDQNYLGETDAANDTQVVYTNEPQLYGSLVSQRRASTSHWYHFDAIGSTRELTDSSAVVTDTRLYDAWGTLISATGGTPVCFLYSGASGLYFSTVSPLYYARARYYSATPGSWKSGDPIFSTSPYLYAGNRPTVHIDPSGLYIITDNEPWPVDDTTDRCPEFGRKDTHRKRTTFRASAKEADDVAHLYNSTRRMLSWFQRVTVEFDLTLKACKGDCCKPGCCTEHTMKYKAVFTEKLGGYDDGFDRHNLYQVNTEYKGMLEGHCGFSYNPCCGYSYTFVITKRLTLAPRKSVKLKSDRNSYYNGSAAAEFTCDRVESSEEEMPMPPTAPPENGKNLEAYPEMELGPVWVNTRTSKADIPQCKTGKFTGRWEPYKEQNK